MGGSCSTPPPHDTIEHRCSKGSHRSRVGGPPRNTSRRECQKYRKILSAKVKSLRCNLKNPRVQTACLQDFSVLGYLGGGAFGQVVKVQHRTTNVYYALKIQSKDNIMSCKNQLDRLLNEKHILAATNFGFIVKLFSSFKDNACVYLVLELVPCGDFFEMKDKYRRSLDENMGRFYVGQVLLALEYLHAASVIYRDLKPENLLVSADGYLKLTDFGYAKPLRSRAYTFCGTPEYIAPEVFTKRGYAQSVDYWTLGILMYEILFQTTPFYSRTTEGIYNRIQNDSCRFPKNPKVSEQSLCLMTRLLDKDVTKRIGVLCNGADDVKTHSWFGPISWLSLYEKRYPAPLEPRPYQPKHFDVRKIPRSDVVLYEREFRRF